ncbi:hypothetical protein DV515_00018346, partial [Chloebia gouldiae]
MVCGSLPFQDDRDIVGVRPLDGGFGRRQCATRHSPHAAPQDIDLPLSSRATPRAGKAAAGPETPASDERFRASLPRVPAPDPMVLGQAPCGQARAGRDLAPSLGRLLTESHAGLRTRKIKPPTHCGVSRLVLRDIGGEKGDRGTLGGLKPLTVVGESPTHSSYISLSLTLGKPWLISRKNSAVDPRIRTRICVESVPYGRHVNGTERGWGRRVRPSRAGAQDLRRGSRGEGCGWSGLTPTQRAGSGWGSGRAPFGGAGPGEGSGAVGGAFPPPPPGVGPGPLPGTPSSGQEHGGREGPGREGHSSLLCFPHTPPAPPPSSRAPLRTRGSPGGDRGQPRPEQGAPPPPRPLTRTPPPERPTLTPCPDPPTVMSGQPEPRQCRALYWTGMGGPAERRGARVGTPARAGGAGLRPSGLYSPAPRAPGLRGKEDSGEWGTTTGEQSSRRGEGDKDRGQAGRGGWGESRLEDGKEGLKAGLGKAAEGVEGGNGGGRGAGRGGTGEATG